MEVNKMTMEIFSKLEQQWLYKEQCLQNTINTDAKKTKILSIDGGGTSAFVAGTFLVHIEDAIIAKTGDSSARVVDFFDIVAGTGMGAVLAVLLSASDSATGRPLFSAREAVSFLVENAPDMFKSKKSGMLRRRSSHRFSAGSLAKVMKQTLKEKTLKDTCKPVLIPCFDMNTAAPFVFSSAAACATSLDFELWKVCCAAVATPSLFEPFELTSVDGKTVCLAVDGGLVMNNPTAAAVTHVLHNMIDFPAANGVEDLLVFSLGNGTLSCRGSGGNNRSKSKGKSVTNAVVDIAVDGVSETVDQMLSNAFSWNRQDYVRIQANGFGGSGLTTMEEVLKERGIESLSFGGKRMLEETNGDRIQSFVQRLVAASGKSSLPPSPYKSISPLLDGR